MKVLGIGHALVDAYAFVDDEVPAALGLHSGTFNKVPDYRMKAIVMTMKNRTLMAGGSAANVVKLCAQFGMQTFFVSKCGNDSQGILFESELLEAGVQTSLVKTESPTGTCVTFLTPSRGRTIATFRSASAELPPDLVSDAMLLEADAVVVEGYLLDDLGFMTALLKRCKVHGKDVFFDIADKSLANQYREQVLTFVREGMIQYLFANEEEAVVLSEADPEETLRKLTPLLKGFIMKKGDEGCQILVDGKVVSVPSTGPAALDSTGAGDAVEAGVLWGLAKGKSLLESCRCGTLLASHVIQIPGTKLEKQRLEKMKVELDRL